MASKVIEWTKTGNPAEGIELLGKQKEFQPWQEWFQAEYVARAPAMPGQLITWGLAQARDPATYPWCNVPTLTANI